MDWDELAPLTDEQTESITELEQMIMKISPIVQDIDKTKLEIIEPSELSTLPSNHKLRDRYNELQLKQQQLLETKDEKYDENDEDDEYKYRQKPPKFNYINYFINQMKQERNTALQLTKKQQESWNYLTENANYMRNIVSSIESLQNVMKQLNEIYTSNENECLLIHNKCMHLIEEQKQLELESNKLKEMVKYFADYNQIRVRISSHPKLIDILSNEFANIVIRINECILFLQNNKQYKESEQYLKNYEILRGQCIKLIKHYILQRLEKAQNDSTKINENNHNENKNNINNINILEYRAAASTLRPLIQLIENEAKICENYAKLLNDLQKLILNERHESLKQLVDETIITYSKTRNTPNLIRASTSYVMLICLREYKLFNEFFDLHLTLKKSLLKTIAISSHKKRKSRPRLSSMSSNKSNISGSVSPTAKYSYISNANDDSENENENEMKEEADTSNASNIINGLKRINSLIKDLCSLLYSYVRPFIIKTSSMQILCDIIHILQCEIKEHLQLTQTQNELNDEFDSNIPEFDRTIVRIIEDAQERLVFRTQIHLRDEIQNYIINENDLNYYKLLQKIYINENENENEIIQRYSDWSPILEKTLSILSKIYPVLNHSVFEFLAYEAVSCSVTSLVDLAKRLAHIRSSIYGHLFLIKHLLILRICTDFLFTNVSAFICTRFV